MALIDDSAEIKRHNSAIAVDFEIESLQSFLDDANTNYIIPAVGLEQFNELVANKATLEDGSTHRSIFLLLQKAALNFAIANYSAYGAVEISNSGISVSKSEKKLPASDKKLMALRKQSFTEGFTVLEVAIDYLETFINEFPSYAASAAHQRNRSLFINSSQEYPQKIRVNAELFQSIKGIQQGIEGDYIETVLGQQLATDIRDGILNNTLTAIQKELLKRIRTAVASLTIAEAIPYQLVSLDGTGAYVMSETVGGISGNVENRNPAELNRLQLTMNKLLQDGQADLEKLRLWLNAHQEEFVTYVPSSEAIIATINDDPLSNIYFM